MRLYQKFGWGSGQGKRQLVFSGIAAAFIGLGVFAQHQELLRLVTGWMLPVAHPHRHHYLVLAGTLWALVIGMGAAAVWPHRALVGLYQALVVIGLYAILPILGERLIPETIVFLGIGVVAAGVHPAGRYIPFLEVEGLDTRLAIFVLIAAIPLLPYVDGQLYYQAARSGSHAALAHWAIMAVAACSIIGLGALASLRPLGWQLPAGSAGGLAIIFSISSMQTPTLPSSPGFIWGALALCWGICMLLVALLPLTPSPD